MKKTTQLTLALLACCALLAIPSMAADKTAPASTSATHSAAVQTGWPAEMISGRFTMVEPGLKRLVIEGSDRVPFDMIVTPGTRIEAGSQRVRLGDLSRYQNKPVSIRFVPESRGDIAKSIRIEG